MSRERRKESPGRLYAACCQDRLDFVSQPRINLQVSHLTSPLLSSFLSPVPFEWSNVNETSDHPTPERSTGGPSTAVALQRTKIRSRFHLPSSLPKKVSSFNPMPAIHFLLPSPAFPPPRRHPNKLPLPRLPAQTPYPKAPPPLLPDPRPPFFPDGLLQTY